MISIKKHNRIHKLDFWINCTKYMKTIMERKVKKSEDNSKLNIHCIIF